MKKFRQLSRRSDSYPTVTGISALVVLGVNLMMVGRVSENVVFGEEAASEYIKIVNHAAIGPLVAILFLVFALFHAVQCMYCAEESKSLCLQHLLYCLLLGVAAALFIVSGETSALWSLAGLLYYLAILISRIISVIRNRNKWNVFMLVIIILLGLICFLLSIGVAYVVPDAQDMISIFVLSICSLMITVQGIAMIVPVSFAHVPLDVLKKIIKKTYATEILSGIILLIVGFSFVLPVYEPGIDNFGDALWYCFAIVTTIGFGDLYATSVIGRIVSVILGIYGIIVVSLITSIIVNFYGEVKKEDHKDSVKQEKSPQEE